MLAKNRDDFQNRNRIASRVGGDVRWMWVGPIWVWMWVVGGGWGWAG